MATRPRRRAALALAALALAAQAGCTGIINNNPDLRWFLFSHFGASKICPEMVKTGVPIKLQERAPATGRFFPAQCAVDVDQARRVVVVKIAGSGYGYVMPAKRVGFTLAASVEYRPDFTIAGDDTYVWAKVNRIIDGPHFQMGYAENPVVDVMGNLPGLGSVTNTMGQQVVVSALTQGFTVIHNDDRGDDFSLGLLFPPQRPHHPFNVNYTERFTFGNETTDVQPGQRDFLGPFEVPSSGKGLLVSVQVQGPAIETILVDKAVGDAWRFGYQTGRPLWPAPGPMLARNPVPAGGADTRRYDLPPGQYYVVLDNTGGGGGGLSSILAPLSPIGLGVGNAAGGLARINVVTQLAN